MKTPKCPLCDRIDATAKVTAIVNRDTRHSDSSRTSASPALDGDEIAWSISHESATSTSQTALARQLSFPDKGGTAMVAGWVVLGLLAFFGTAWYLVRTDMQDNVTPGGADDDLDLLNFLVNGSVVGAIVALCVALIATPVHFRGRAEARRIWETLYYCMRDDIVYSARQHTPATSMRQILRY